MTSIGPSPEIKQTAGAGTADFVISKVGNMGEQTAGPSGSIAVRGGGRRRRSSRSSGRRHHSRRSKGSRRRHRQSRSRRSRRSRRH